MKRVAFAEVKVDREIDGRWWDAGAVSFVLDIC